MKKLSLFLIAVLSIIGIQDVYAGCGDIDNLKSNIGTIKAVGDTKYLITVPKGTKEVTLTGSTKYSFEDGLAPRTVSTSEKDFQIVVAENEECGRTPYTLNFAFEEAAPTTTPNENNGSTNNTPTTTKPETTNPTQTKPVESNNSDKLKLNKLEIKGISIPFNSNTYSYDVDVDLDIEKIEIEAEADEGIEVVISENANALLPGENEVTVTLNSEGKEPVIYTINVNRMEQKSNNNYLGSLTISNHQLNFDPSTEEYTVTISDETALDIEATPESEKATYEIIGNSNLKDGSVVTIRITAEDGSKRDYKINISRPFNIMDYTIYIAIALLVILLVLLILIGKNKKKKKKQEEAKPEEVALQEVTAGTIQSAQTAEAIPQDLTQFSSQELNSLEIIEPTDIASTTTVENQAVSEDDSKTEVFKL